ncbi:MAG: hypothetical protein GEU98_11570 [Pseudonocardiaceae bacterium]|nr:hypothetical protein [Pseudonocardiaceae bacterium]
MLMWAVTCAGVALLGWPRPPSSGRIRKLVVTAIPVTGPALLRRPDALLLALAAVAGWLLLGPGGAVAAGLAAGTGWWRWRARRALHSKLAAYDGLADALRALVLELRAGAHPADAAESVAVDAHPQAALPMRAIAGTARLGGDVGRALAGSAVTVPSLSRALGQLVRTWLLVQRHGLPLADVLDAVRRELDERVRFANQVRARMAGPRASALVLALLPAVGVLLGEAMGAGPLRVLAATPSGQVLLAVGVALICAGVAWSARLTEQAVLS